MHPIKIDYKRKLLSNTVTVDLGQSGLTAKEIKEHVSINAFDIDRDGYNCYVLTIYNKRAETDEEFMARIKSEEAYMVEYKRRKQDAK